MSQQQMHWQTQVETLQQKYIQSQKECQDVQKNLASQRMEMTMYQSATRTKIGELQTHKKILKKEVIELRKRLEDANSHVDLFKHKETSVKLECEQERQKTKVLERYVEKMETQVKVQQNMMELMPTSFPEKTLKVKEKYPAKGKKIARVALLTGCVQKELSPQWTSSKRLRATAAAPDAPTPRL